MFLTETAQGGKKPLGGHYIASLTLDGLYKHCSAVLG
jgi:hypothetical protein